MSKFTDVDLWFTDSGDLAVDSTGDLRDTANSYGKAVLQEISDRLKSNQGDWKLLKSIGCNLEGFLGDPATRKHLDKIINRVKEGLSFDRLLGAEEFMIVPIEVGKSIVLFRLIIKTQEGELEATIGYDSDNKRFLGY